MADVRPTWELVLTATRALTAAGGSPFKLAELVAAVQQMDPSRGHGSIQPVVQGMTVNAGKGPLSPCGKVLTRVERGYYMLAEGDQELRTPEPSGKLGPTPDRGAPATRPTARRGRSRTLGPADVRARVDDLIATFDACAAHYDADVPFTRLGQFELHQHTIERRRALGSAEAAAHDDQFTGLLHAVLQAWGIGRRASRLAPLDDFRLRLGARASELRPLERLALEDPTLDVETTVTIVDRLVTELGVVDNQARIVAGTKTLHHLVPDLVPPMDRAWTGAFFGWSVLDPQNHQTAILTEAFTYLAEVAAATRPSRLVGPGWRTSPTKVVDNALIGYCKLHGFGGTPT